MVLKKKNVGPFTYSDGRLEELLFNLMKWKYFELFDFCHSRLYL